MQFKLLIFNQSNNDLWALVACVMLKIENAFYAKSGLYNNIIRFSVILYPVIETGPRPEIPFEL